MRPGTLIWYGEILKRWVPFLESHGVTLAKEVSPNLIRLSFEAMRERGVSQNTVARAYGGLRCFFGFLSRERMIPQNPFQLVEKPRMEKKLIKPLSMDQARLLLAAIKTKRWTDHNLRTIMVLILDTGLRVSEVIGLRRDQVDFQAGVLRVMGKGAKERRFPARIYFRQPLRRKALPLLDREGNPDCMKFNKIYLRKAHREAILQVLGKAHEKRG